MSFVGGNQEDTSRLSGADCVGNRLADKPVAAGCAQRLGTSVGSLEPTLPNRPQPIRAPSLSGRETEGGTVEKQVFPPAVPAGTIFKRG